MDNLGTWIVWPILLPLIAIIPIFLRKRSGAANVSLVTAAAIVLVVAGLARQVLTAGEQSHAIGGWDAPLGIMLHADGLSVFMLMMTAIVGAVTSIYAAGYRFQGGGDPGISSGYFFWPLGMFLWAALNVIFLAADIFNLYIGLELLSMAAVALVTLEQKRDATVAGMRYLLASFLGSLAYLLGVALLYTAFGTLDLELLGARIQPDLPTAVAIILITLGTALKTALFPLHFWLPPAHGSAPTPVSALLSALVVKASFYLLLRLWFEVFPAALTPTIAQLLGLLGAIGILWGSFLALRQHKLKALVAFSTVAQVGYLFLLFPLASTSAGWGVDAWSGGVYHAFAHACAKAAMFMAAGTLAYAIGSDQLESLAGTFQHYPFSVTALTLAGVSLMGLPPSGGFIGKWLLLNSALASGQWWFALVILTGSLLATGYVTMVLGHILLRPPDATTSIDPRNTNVSFTLEFAALLLALIAIGLGLAATPMLALLRIGMPFTGY